MIYFLHAAELARVKIGFSRNVEDRMIRIRDGSPTPLVLLATCPGDMAREAKLHRTFRAQRVHNEWFSECEPLRSLCDRLSRVDNDSEKESIIEEILTSGNTSKVVWDEDQERRAFSESLKIFIRLHGSKKFREVSGLGKQMERLVRLRGNVIGPVPFKRLLDFDPLPFVGFWPFSEDDLRRLYRELGALICGIEARRDAA